MNNKAYVIGAFMLAGLILLFGIHIGSGCNKPNYVKGKTDTVVNIVARPVTVRDTIKTKSVMIKYKDTTYFIDRPIEIPCKDTAFVAQADSVITNTQDTVNMAFNYRNGLGYFSLVFKPRPDSIKTINIPIEKQVTDYTWLPATLGLGIITGIIIGASAKP